MHKFFYAQISDFTDFVIFNSIFYLYRTFKVFFDYMNHIGLFLG